MLKPAQLYKEKLQEENIKSWYNKENKYQSGCPGFWEIEFSNNNYDCHQFVSIDKEDNVIGYIAYDIDWVTMSAKNFGIISYKKNSLEFARDLYTAICNLFEIYHMNRISWTCFVGNPAMRGYQNFIKKHGGRKCGYQRECVKLQDGLLHDSVTFEILAKEFKK